LVAAGRTDGQVRDGSAELLAKCDTAERTLSGEMQLVMTTLQVLRQQLRDSSHRGAIVPDYGREALASIDALARRYLLKLLFSIAPI
jgi:hypothetical protein